MTIQPIGGDSAALYITPADLRRHGLTAETLTGDAAMALARDAFSQAGLPLEGPVEIEAYPDKCGVLVFVRLQPPQRLWLSFDDFEALLSALRACPVGAEETALLWWEDRWWLSLPGSAGQLHTALSEFGSTEAPDPCLEARMAEHGHAVAAGDALAALAGHFER